MQQSPHQQPIHYLPAVALKACRWLRERGYAPTYSEYPLGHNVFAEEIAEVGRCLRTWLN